MEKIDPEFAAKVANDVAEDVDCHETRAQLREIVRFFAIESCTNRAWRSLSETDAKTLRLAVTMLIPLALKVRVSVKEAPRKRWVIKLARLLIKTSPTVVKSRDLKTRQPAD